MSNYYGGYYFMNVFTGKLINTYSWKKSNNRRNDRISWEIICGWRTVNYGRCIPILWVGSRHWNKRNYVKRWRRKYHSWWEKYNSTWIQLCKYGNRRRWLSKWWCKWRTNYWLWWTRNKICICNWRIWIK